MRTHYRNGDGARCDDCLNPAESTYDDGFRLYTDDSEWWEIDGPMGVDIVPGDLVGCADLAAFDPDNGLQPFPSDFADYCENRECWTIKRCNGWRAWLAMPGYMDRTSDCIGDSEREAVAAVIELHGICDDSPMPEWEAEARDEFGIDD